MRNKSTGEADGIVRVVKDDGEILESSFKADRAHGLVRRIKDSKIDVAVAQNKKHVAVFRFYDDFQEFARDDPYRLLVDLKVDRFRLLNY